MRAQKTDPERVHLVCYQVEIFKRVTQRIQLKVFYSSGTKAAKFPEIVTSWKKIHRIMANKWNILIPRTKS